MSQPHLQTRDATEMDQIMDGAPVAKLQASDFPCCCCCCCCCDAGDTQTASVTGKGAERGSGCETHSRLAEVDVDLHGLKGFLLKQLSGFRWLASFIRGKSNTGCFRLTSRGGGGGAGGGFVFRPDNAPCHVKNLTFYCGEKDKHLCENAAVRAGDLGCAPAGCSLSGALICVCRG